MGMFDTLSALVLGRRNVVQLEDAAPGDASAVIGALIADLSGSVALEPRKGSTDVYLEAVLVRENLTACTELLDAVLGPPAKPFDRRVAFDPAVQELVDSRGGIAKNQCLWLRRYSDGQVAFAALWPWSNGREITLKVGVYGDRLDRDTGQP